MALKSWVELPVSVRRSRRKLYEYIKTEMDASQKKEETPSNPTDTPTDNTGEDTENNPTDTEETTGDS